MLFPFFGADGNGIHDLEPKFREVPVKAGVKAPKNTWSHGVAMVDRVKKRYEQNVLSTECWKNFPDVVDGYRQIAIGNNWAIFIAYVEAGSEESARRWFREKMLHS